MDSNSLRRAFTNFFVERGHTAVPSSGVIPHHPTAPLFTNAGMNQFVPYFLGEEPAPYPRATSIQKCIRLSGKHNDIDELGKTRRHMSFFEMLGNFSFGDYFKEDAIKFAWELLTEGVGFDGERLWITVHTSDDEAEAIWHEQIGVPMDRIQRLGKDNFWDMGDKGPCGPCSEIHLDCGPEWGDEGGPAHGGGDRYVEFWNLVFMQNQYTEDGGVIDLPRKNVDTGGGLERWLMLLQDVPTVFDTDELRRIIAEAERLTNTKYGEDPSTTAALRVLGDHARTMAVLIEGGVVPSNEERGYICRSVVRRAVRRAYQLGVDTVVLPELVGAAIDISADGFPELVKQKDTILETVEREEVRFRRTLRDGSAVLEQELATGKVRGDVAFQLHDTFGFPIEITAEVAEERGVELDKAGFDERMAEQRRKAKAARKTVAADSNDVSVYREILDQNGRSEFTGYDENESDATVVAVLERGDDTVEIFLNRTPFYAEGGGQVGDTGVITTDTGTADVLDTTAPIPGLHRHIAKVTSGDISVGQTATASIDAARRDSIRRNHTATHLLHWALRQVLGTHVKQQGSRVAPDELRFDFSHHQPMTTVEIAEVERLVNAEVLANPEVGSGEYSKSEAEQMGAIAFFGDKYGDRVRVIKAGPASIEFCGGTHVHALGTIGAIKIVSEESIGANMRRIVAVTGEGTLAWMNERNRLVGEASALLKASPEELVNAVARTLERNKALETELRNLKAASARAEAPTLAATAVNGVVVDRRDGLVQDQLRDLALAVRDQKGINAVVLGGSPEDGKAALVAVVSKQGRDAGLDAGAILADAAKAVQGGGSKNPDMAMAGGKNAAGIDEALDIARAAAGAA